MVPIHNPHDALFKAIFKDKTAAAAEFKALLPHGITALLDFDHMAIDNTLFVDEKLRTGESDLLYRVPLKGQPELAAFVWLLFEHQSSNDRFIALRILEYMVYAWKQWRTENPKAQHLPMILPLVLQHDQQGWSTPLSFGALYPGPPELIEGLHDFLPNFKYILDDLTDQSEDELISRPGSDLLTVLLLTLKSRGDIEKRHEKLLVGAFRALDRQHKFAAIEAILTYSVNTAQRGRPLALAAAHEAGEETRRIAVSYADVLMEKGFAKGVEQGREQGVEQGQEQGRSELLLKLIGLKFGTPDAQTLRAVQEATKAQRDRWAEVILTAKTMDELLEAK
jgi:predicted transposase YdaD